LPSSPVLLTSEPRQQANEPTLPILRTSPTAYYLAAMRQIMTLLLGLAAGIAGAQKLPEPIKLGTSLPMSDHQLGDATREDDATATLGSLQKTRGLLVVFTSNSCPFVVGNGDKSEGWERRYPALVSQARKLDIGVAFVNSNEANRGTTESTEAMRARWKKYKYQAPMLVDHQHQVADAFGARTTPHVFLFDGTGLLVYTGAIDDNVDSAKKVKKNWLMDAMNSVAKGQMVKVPKTKNIGCSIKRIQ